ncbi:MAG TPA: beta-propeller fold lactonase family protein [Candidatus Saccharimonadales bacterium]|nr:beta-propeller fold lactonase family protein [Candidatus Saccharimonadales bacterium]
MLYTQTNPAGPNAIAAFQQNIKTGHLELKALYPTGGIGNPNFAGCSQDTMVSDGEFLYNVNIGSNDISVFRIKGDGSLEQVGNPVPSGGLVPITLAVTHGLLYVGNQGDATTVPANYTGFAIHDGKLTPIPGSTVTLDVTLPGLPGPADLQFTQNSKLLMGTRVSANTVDIFRVTERGLLERTDQLTAPHPFGIGFNPTARGQAIISLEALPGSSSFRIFSNGHGALLHEALDQAAVDSCWVQIRKDGELVWLSGFFGQSITLHRLDENGVLQPLSLHDTSSFGLFASDILLDGRQRFLYEVLPGSGQLHVMHVTGDTANGGLADVETITLPANSFPAGLIIASTSADGQ